MIVLEFAYNYGLSICEARRLTEQEKSGYAEWFQEAGMVGVGEVIELTHLSPIDQLVSSILSRPEDGQFCGCSNTVRIISESEKEQLLSLDAQKKKEKEEKERSDEISWLRERVAALRGRKLYTAEEAKEAQEHWINTQNEGSEGYVPHYPTYDELENAERRLAELEGRDDTKRDP